MTGLTDRWCGKLLIEGNNERFMLHQLIRSQLRSSSSQSGLQSFSYYYFKGCYGSSPSADWRVKPRGAWSMTISNEALKQPQEHNGTQELSFYILTNVTFPCLLVILNLLLYICRSQKVGTRVAMWSVEEIKIEWRFPRTSNYWVHFFLREL